MTAVTPDPTALQPVTAFRSALLAAAVKERAGRARRAERVTAVRGLDDGDLARLVDCFADLLRAPADVGALTAALHAELRALSPETAPEEAPDA
jgi:hypothetical protein